jgi:lysophospholipase L1-like esterase
VKTLILSVGIVVTASSLPAIALAQTAPAAAAPAPAAGQSKAEILPFELRANDHVILIGNTLAERMQHFNHFETQLMTRHPDLQLVVRNLGRSGDTLTLQPRPLNFGDATKHLTEQKADVIVAFFGLNESFDGEAGLPKFEQDLEGYIQNHRQARYNGSSAPRLALVSPIAHEKLAHLVHVDVDGRNRELARYTEAMRKVAARLQVTFVDLYTPTKEAMASSAANGAALTINGIHLNEDGDRIVAGMLLEGLGLNGADGMAMRDATTVQRKQLEVLREAIRDKNQQFFYRWRPLNAEYVVGRRLDPFGSVNFPPEMKQLDKMVGDREKAIWKRAAALKGVRYAEPRTTQSAANAANAGDRK